MTAPRAALYARYSSDRQHDRSIDDQLTLAREYATRKGWRIVAEYHDHAVSGASVHGRGEYQRMLADAEAGHFDIVLAEDVERFGRNAADLMRFREVAEFIGCKIFTIADGEANDLLFGFKSISAAVWLKGHAQKTRRGLDGRIRAGFSAGGRAYGYAAVQGEPGRLIIVEAQAAIVRRIFAEFIAGRSPREIAHRLNAEHVPAPRCPRWNASTINGSRSRQNGILFNPLYAGELVWNRVRMVKNPATGKRISRLNEPSELRRIAAPSLAIVTPEAFAFAAARKAQHAHLRPEMQRRPRHLLAGLLRCAGCGGGMSATGHDKSGRVRIACSTHRESRTCPAPATFYRDAVEATVLAALRAELRSPAVIAEYVREYHAERQRLAAGSRARHGAIERRLAEIARELPRLTDAIAKALGDPAVIGGRMKELVSERDGLNAERERIGEPAPIVALHPHVLARYESQLAELQASLSNGLTAGDGAGATALRDLVESVTVMRTAAGGLQVSITGRLEAVVGTTMFPLRALSGGTLVAGARCGRSAHLARFQLVALA